MAANTSQIKKRINSISSTQKITNAMKLVSLSKLQRYRRQILGFESYFEAVENASKQFLPFDENELSLSKLYVVFMPDLGLCSAYTQGLFQTLTQIVEKDDEIISYGTQMHDFMIRKGLPIINDLESSERLELDDLLQDLSPYIDQKAIVFIVPEYRSSMDLRFERYPLYTKIKGRRDDAIYDPSFELTSSMLIKQSLNALIRYSFLTSKVSEHTTRRIAMEKASDSAQDMIDDLQRVYNQARQEAITQEIAEIVSGMEVS